ncbi:MAG: bifunctional molybdenum cofactor biosynthesis protein MoaC/MoaB, partial [Candidatus Marinimicrobia bacterium]|nr:bifunctional molybdenum cofactor biosynthesis protein MoaC/MoaB [Candidatus Neomarinimicrobiota bacterium]
CHQINLSFVDIEFEFKSNSIWVRSIVKTKESTGVEMEALSAVSIALLAVYDMCKAVDKTMEISGVKLIEKNGGKSDYATRYRPKVGVVTLSDGVVRGKREDISGKILADGFLNSGCVVDHRIVLEDGSDQLVPMIYDWIDSGVELILTTGGTGLSPRDLTIEVLESIFESKLTGVEQALHAYGRGKIKTAMLSRLTAGLVKGTLVICLPGSSGATRDALEVLIPTIFHSFHMLKGEQH